MRLRTDDARILLTGASSGIGLEMARLIATRWKTAKALALVARRVDRLEKLKQELTALNPALEVHLLPCDLCDLEATARLPDQAIAAMGRVDILINNAGVGHFGLFDRSDEKKTADLLMLNVNSLVLLTHRLVKPMVERKRGGILNISSGYGLGFTPAFAGYIGSKHFVTGFTESLRLDLSGTGVVVSQVCPGPVSTEFASTSGEGLDDAVPKFMNQKATSCALASVRGFERGRALILSGWVMRLVVFLLAISPRFMVRWSQGWLARRWRKTGFA
jgi:uncharacterized protein